MSLTKEEHLEKAAAYARPLNVERQVSVGTAGEVLRADQGAALRATIYHCTAAIVGAITEHMHATKR